MKVRIKFSKCGALKFIGHLDVMRYFQKLMRRADIPIAYSEGFSPHQIMSFAMPLGIGDESIAEYVDIELNSYISSNDAINRLNEKSVDEIRILSFKEIPEGKAYNAMSSISAASYEIKISDENKPEFDFEKAFYDLLDKEQVIVTKQSKKSENTLDIKPFIYEYNINGDVISLLVSCGSVMNIKPELVIKAVFDSMNKEFDEYFITIKRTEMYTGVYNEKSFKSLENVGKDIL